MSCHSTIPHRNDPLLEKIFQAKDLKELNQTELITKMSRADVIYLSEKHDNPRHHEIQLEILESLVAQGKKPAIGFEFFSVDQTGYLMEYVSGVASPFVKKSPHSKEMLLRRNLGWADASDERWKFYFSLIDFAKKHHLRAFGTDISPGLTLRIRRFGLNQLSTQEKKQLHDSGFSDPNYEKLMHKKFTAAHCGWSSPVLLDKLYQTWVARNDAMANSIVDFLGDNENEPVVMIVGGGHTEHNMGIVERVAHLRPKVKQLDLGLSEIAMEQLGVEAYFEGETIDTRTFSPPHEFLWFTKRKDYEDVCAKFRETLKRKDEKHQ